MEEKMKCWRVYVDGEIAGTYFSSIQAHFKASEFFGAGYTAEQVDVVKEDYEYQ